MDAFVLNPESKPVFMCCDLQEKFAPAFGHNFELAAFVAKRLLAAHGAFHAAGAGTRFVVTEQYPKGLGPTCSDVAEAAAAQPALFKYEKTKFSMMVDEVDAAVGDAASFVLFGIEAHVCVLQTVADLRMRGKNVFVVVDGTFSQRDGDRDVAFRTMERMGATLTTSEAVLFQLLGDKNHAAFKAVSALCRDKPPAPLATASVA